MNKTKISPINPLDGIERQEDINELLMECYTSDPDGVLFSGVVECLCDKYGIQDSAKKVFAFFKTNMLSTVRKEPRTATTLVDS